MKQRDYDPLDIIPDPEVIRGKLHDVERRAERLRILLRVSEEIHELEPREKLEESVRA